MYINVITVDHYYMTAKSARENILIYVSVSPQNKHENNVILKIFEKVLFFMLAEYVINLIYLYYLHFLSNMSNCLLGFFPFDTLYPILKIVDAEFNRISYKTCSCCILTFEKKKYMFCEIFHIYS